MKKEKVKIKERILYEGEPFGDEVKQWVNQIVIADGLEYRTVLIRYDGKILEKPMSVSWLLVRFQWNPLKWRLKKETLWYDGQHTFYDILFLQISDHGIIHI